MPAGATVAGQADAFAALLGGLGIDRLDVAAISSGATSDALRALLVGGFTARPVLLAVAWTAGLVVVLALLAGRRYRRG